ncbi:MAG TPA: carbohydrate-binding family 9-like protein [Sunxiuqinia sp.]|nr:carbohydrate-binding family 9-like protein [Sunxiuqinia sp.]
MKTAIPFIKPANSKTQIKGLLEPFEYNAIGNFPWGEPQPKPSVQFKIAHDNDAILIHYDVGETETLARYCRHNDPVYKDSCVEFFIAFNSEKHYYNFEFNCFGTCLAGWGPDRNARLLLPVTLIDQIYTNTTIQRYGNDSLPFIHWQLSIRIPISVFKHSSLKHLKKQKARANFYKCGDELSQPHFVSWKNIQTAAPDFHQPDFFGDIEFL